uniref:Pentacotripeptide-repeat region of PRORP domain-containing protein n=1 Tax=Rhodosorus marinus TaxID=101924 RepID=A0A7S3A8C3_9RHOD|mmetsp:Transcript_5751/g.24236  ORF Transcript_5751/g.24236 Transcript_5751/m.24236 type:complete len:250 (+) Transcript_5751:357-1106(+)
MLNTSSSAWRRASSKNAIFANGGLRWFRVPSLEARVEDCTRVVDMWLNGLGQANQKLVQRMVRLLAYQGHVDQARDVIKIGQRKAKAKFTDVGPYVPVLDVLTNRKMVAEAREVIAEMFEDELRITPACIHILVRLLRNTGDTLELLRVNNVELTPQVLRWVLNATLMNKLDLQPIGAELKNQGLKLDPGMYLCLMDDALARGKYDEFKEVSTRALSDEGVTRNEAFYSKLVALYSKVRVIYEHEIAEV